MTVALVDVAAQRNVVHLSCNTSIDQVYASVEYRRSQVVLLNPRLKES
jgi:hypothetical protein